MEVSILTTESLSAIRTEWLDQIADDEMYDLTNSTFENILASKTYGDYRKRLSLNTYVLVEENGENLALAEIVISMIGRESICKIFDITHAPVIYNLNNADFLKKSIEILLTILKDLLILNKASSRGRTKIYARHDLAQLTMNFVHEGIDKERFRELGFDVKLQGKHWLSFEKIS